MRNVKQDTGWCWLVCFGSSIAMLLETGMVKALGVTIPYLQEQFSTDIWVIGLVISLIPGFGAISCLLGGPFTKATSPRVAMITLGLISSIGLVVGSFARSIPLLVSAVLLIGCSFGAEAVTLAALPIYFDKYLDLTNGIAHAGISIGLMILPPLTQFLLDTFGWQGTFLILGGLNFNLVVCGAMLRPLETSDVNRTLSIITVDERHRKKAPASSVDTPEGESCKTSIVMSIIDYIDLDLLLNFDFVTILCICTATGYFFTGWVIYFVPHLLAYGFKPHESSFLATVGGVGNLMGTVAFPLISRYLSGKHMIYIFSLLTALALAFDPAMATLHWYFGIMISSFVVNLGFAVIDCCLLKEVVDVIEDKTKLSTATNWGFVGYATGSIASGFLSGWLYECFGNYTTSFLILGMTLPLSRTPWLIRDITYAVKGNNQYEKLS